MSTSRSVMLAAAALLSLGMLGPMTVPAEAAACTPQRAASALRQVQTLKAKGDACQRAAASGSRARVCSACGTFLRTSSSVYSKLKSAGVSCRTSMSADQYSEFESNMLALGNVNTEMRSALRQGC